MQVHTMTATSDEHPLARQIREVQKAEADRRDAAAEQARITGIETETAQNLWPAVRGLIEREIDAANSVLKDSGEDGAFSFLQHPQAGMFLFVSTLRFATAHTNADCELRIERSGDVKFRPERPAVTMTGIKPVHIQGALTDLYREGTRHRRFIKR